MYGRAGAGSTEHAAFGVDTTNTRNALEVVPTRRKPLTNLLNTLKAVHPVGRREVIHRITRNSRRSVVLRCNRLPVHISSDAAFFYGMDVSFWPRLKCRFP